MPGNTHPESNAYCWLTDSMQSKSLTLHQPQYRSFAGGRSPIMSVLLVPSVMSVSLAPRGALTLKMPFVGPLTCVLTMVSAPVTPRYEVKAPSPAGTVVRSRESDGQRYV